MENTAQEHWLRKLADENEVWIPADRVEQWPSVIAYEYRHLRQLCRDGSAYGAMLRIKDCFETLLKLETLIAFAWADRVAFAAEEEREQYEDFRRNVISQLTTPGLSFGSWAQLALRLEKELKKQEKAIPRELLLKVLSNKYDELDIVYWRNEKIGHGALALEEDEEFREDLKDRVRELGALLGDMDEKLRNTKLFVNGLQLKGPDLARGLEADGEITCTLEESGITFSVDPYILIRKHERRGKGVYFFDAQKTKTLTTFLAYADGSRTNTKAPFFEQLNKQRDTSTILFDLKPDDQYLTDAEIRDMEVLQMSDSYIRPAHLIKWLRDSVRNHDRGVFLLQMERGMGKSVFTDKLNMLYDSYESIADDLDVRTYHFTRTQSAGADDFYTHVESLWTSSGHAG